MVPDYKEMVVGHYNFIDEDVHGKHIFHMFNNIKSFKTMATKQITLYNILKRWKDDG